MRYDTYSLATQATVRNSQASTPTAPTSLKTADNPAVRGASLEAMLDPRNVEAAWDRVRKNNGAPGVDGITIGELKPVFLQAWTRTQAAIEAGEYHPLPVRRVEMPKRGGGTRVLGIPAVMDRVVQQAIAQVLGPKWESRFSNASYAYRPGRGAHGALACAVQWMEAGCAWAAHLDIEKFFDNVDHNRLLNRLSEEGADVRIQELVARFLVAGGIEGGLWKDAPQGTPQGSPLSPLLANIVLDGLDHRLEALGARHVRYADDILILGRTHGETAAMVENASAYLLAELTLRLNEEKTRLTPAHEAEFLGFCFRRVADGRWQRAISPASHEGFHAEIAALTEYRPGQSVEAMIGGVRRFVTGWRNYFSVPGEPWAGEQGLGFVRARVRGWIWQSWGTQERRAEELKARGVEPAKAEVASKVEAYSPQVAGVLGVAIPNARFAQDGLAGFGKKRNVNGDRERENGRAAVPRPTVQSASKSAAVSRPAGDTPRDTPASSPKAAHPEKRRGWFFNFSLGRFFTFRFLSETAPGVLARPERRQAAEGAKQPLNHGKQAE